jgi:hypothetical protein
MTLINSWDWQLYLAAFAAMCILSIIFGGKYE